MIKKEEFTFDSRDGISKIHAVRWIPEGEIVCILQIVHGMAEHMERYGEVAQYFAEKGILVTGEDHLGHGKSVATGGTYGYFCKQDPATVIVRDVHRLKKMTQEAYPGIPYVILGHSLGSYMLRNYLFRYGEGIQGAILCGTGSMPQGVISGAKVLAKIQELIFGGKHTAKRLNDMAFGAHNKRVQPKRTDKDWLCTDEKVIDIYNADPLCGFTFTVNGFQTMFEIITRLNREDNLKKMPKKLPVFFIAGEEDPVGEYGAGVRTAYSDFEKAGMERIALKLYAGDRHEILNEKDKEQVYEDIYPWIMERVKEYQD